MATVLGTIELEFSSGATVTTIVEAPLEPGIFQALSGAPVPLWDLGLDLPGLLIQFGPVTAFSWRVDVIPTVISLPPALWLFLGALGMLFWRWRPAPHPRTTGSQLTGPAAGLSSLTPLPRSLPGP